MGHLVYDRWFILKLLIHHLNLEFSIFSDVVEPQIKEQLEAAKDAEIGEVVSAQQPLCAVWKNNFRSSLSFSYHPEFSKPGTKESGLVRR